MTQQPSSSATHPHTDARKLQDSMAAIKNKILVLSGKGGVGKTTVAVNLASELARQGFQVGLLDVDLHGPTVPRMVGLAGRHCYVENEQIVPLQVSEQLKVMSVAFLLDHADNAVIWRGPMKNSVIQKLLADTRWGDLDYLIIDAPPGTGDEPLSAAQLVGKGAAAVLVTTPQQIAIDDVRRCVTFCRQLNLPIYGLIENMAFLPCPHCGNQVRIFGSNNGGSELASQAQIDLLGSLPIDPAIAEGADSGQTVNDSNSSALIKTKLENIVSTIINKTNQ